MVEDLKTIGNLVRPICSVRMLGLLSKLLEMSRDKGKDLSDCITQIAEDRATFELLDFHELAGEHPHSGIGITERGRGLYHTVLHCICARPSALLTTRVVGIIGIRNLVSISMRAFLHCPLDRGDEGATKHLAMESGAP